MASKITQKRQWNVRYLLHTRRYLTIAVGLAVVCIGLTFGVIIPQAQAVLDIFSQLQQKQSTVSQLEQKARQLQSLPQSEMLARSDNVNRVLPSKKPLLEVLSALNEIAGPTDVRFEDLALSPGKIASQSAQEQADAEAASSRRRVVTGQEDQTRSRTAIPGVDAIDVELIVIGQLANINQFLEEIEQVAPLITVTQMGLVERSDGALTEDNQQSGLSGQKVFEADLQIRTFYFTEAIRTTIAKPVPQLTQSQRQILNVIDDYRYPIVLTGDVIQGGGLEDLFGVEPRQFLQ